MGGTTIESLHAMIVRIPPLEPTAQALLDRARSILTSGPPLSMNVELADGEDLPVALHTLNQGAVWACLLGGGANPDLEDRALDEAHEKQLGNTDIHNRIRNALTPEAKCLWFLCRKFFFTLNVAEKDGKCYQHCLNGFYHHRMYMGRLFMLDTKHHTALTRARMPRALEVYSDGFTHIARTPKGMWGWGESDYGQLGFRSLAYREFVDPTRLTFPACPKIAELEASLPSWEKHRMVINVSLDTYVTFIHTPVGIIMTGRRSVWYTGDIEEENKYRFNPVAVPFDFVPDRIMHGRNNAVILSMGDRQVITGHNECGQLGLGHKHDMTGFVDLPFRVYRVMSGIHFNIFLSGRQLLYAGQVPRLIAHSGLLPGYSEGDICLTATPLRFPDRVKAFFVTFLDLIWVTEGCTHLCDYDKQLSVSAEATAFERVRVDGRWAHPFRASTGQWFETMCVSDGAGLTECEAPKDPDELIPVDIDPATAP
ncbi:hypothetical protein J8273_8759 [Carpediemonas membranifera]|uniref:Uncharacterized protein n=1 Tax=Carpediemonas membranifera TaxID=201153 RepID=A0A8J6E0K6_9EUKA|nr:hypothetical protein J8273_8759 [Carpediemonas membranifera]|eukprot:KAG9389467.1 hypothetical protein J8273_8759 [Carpediemonas membranifera]